MNSRTHWALLLAIIVGLNLALTGCGGGGGGGSDPPKDDLGPANTTGILLPTEISAISSLVGTGEALSTRFRALAAAVATLPATSDYVTTKAARYVDEPALEVFAGIESILQAVAQTNYADAGNIGSSAATAVPYKVLVAWEESRDGKMQKELEEWSVKSFMATEGELEVNIVHLWIVEEEREIRVEVRIYQAPEQDDAGNYLNYGIWKISAIFDEVEGDFFYADATVEDGVTVLRLREESREDMDGSGIPLERTMRAIMYRTADTGYGKAEIPDYEYCWNRDGEDQTNLCVADGVIPTDSIQYAYNTSHLALKLLDHNGAPAGELYKDRTDPVDIAYRYSLFDAVTGQNVEKVKSFGFPVTFSDAETAGTRRGYYGAWQGRHQLWAGPDGGSLPSGMAVQKETWGEDVPVSYTTLTYQGSLTKRTLVPASLSQIKDIPMQIWLSDHFDLQYDSILSGWKKCTYERTGEYEWNQSCSETAFDLASLTASEGKWINVNRYNDQESTYHNYSYNNGIFVEAEGSFSPGSTYGPDDWAGGDRLWVSIGGSIYIAYTGNFASGATGWVEKTVTAFDEQTRTPTFDDSADVAFDFPREREYYINNSGVNFVITRTATADSADSYLVKMETQTLVRPDNLSTIFPTNTSYFASEWEPEENRSTFQFDNTTMLLKYRTVGSNAPAGAVVGGIATQGNWGLAAYDASNVRIDNAGSPVQFNWEYASDANPWGAVTYLVKSDDAIEYLDDPIRLNPLQLTTLGGDQLTFSLQFDGWMHGLPDMRWELHKNDYLLTAAIRNKVVNIPAGTVVTDNVTGGSYLIKPLEIGVILPTLPEAPPGAPELVPADGISLDVIPTADPQLSSTIGPMPTGTTMKYVEGKPIL